MKQARAFGVGVVLSTQNPVDLDYKAMSNAGTWMIGRLQTDRDKARLLDGMASAAGSVDVAAVDATISGLGKREFVLRRAGKDQPEVFTTRWAMSYLRGPMTRDQIAIAHARRSRAASASRPHAADVGGRRSPRPSRARRRPMRRPTTRARWPLRWPTGSPCATSTSRRRGWATSAATPAARCSTRRSSPEWPSATTRPRPTSCTTRSSRR